MNEKRLASHALRELLSSLKLQLYQGKETSTPAAGDATECLDLANSKLWLTNLDWSSEAAQLRESAISNPSGYAVDAAYSALRRLRLVDQKITDLDDGLLKCTDLQELTLTGNYLKSVSSLCLPTNLKVLELCYNELESTSGLRSCSVELLHLGLAYNKLSTVELQPSKWCCLLSLDLSYNHLTDLPSAIKVTTELTKLRNLSLKGNPLSLVPCYRSYTLDSLGGLTLLDDSEITASERESALGVADLCDKQTDLVRHAQVHIEVKSLTGLPELEEIPDTVDQLVRSTLEVQHSLLPHSFSRPPVSAQDIPLDISHDADHRNLHWHKFNPVPYSTTVSNCTSLAASFIVEDLKGFTHFLKGGINVRLCLVRTTYTKEVEGEEKPQNVKHGIGTPPSGRSSAAKKSQYNDTKKETKGKVKVAANGNAGPPGEGWKESSITSIPLANWHMDMTSVLEGKPLVDAILESVLSPGLRANNAFKMIEAGQSDVDIHIGFAVSIQRYYTLSSCPAP